MTSAPKARPITTTRAPARRAARPRRARRPPRTRPGRGRARVASIASSGLALERARPEGVEEQHADGEEGEREHAEAREEEQQVAADRAQQLEAAREQAPAPARRSRDLGPAATEGLEGGAGFGGVQGTSLGAGATREPRRPGPRAHRDDECRNATARGASRELRYCARRSRALGCAQPSRRVQR